MTLTPRAPTTGAQSSKSRTNRRARAFAIVFALVLAGAVVTTQATTRATDRQPTTQTASGTELSRFNRGADAAAADRAPGRAARPQAVAGPNSEHSQWPEPLSPHPPADGRDAPDPAVVHDGEQWALFSTQVGLLNVPVALSDDLRHWSPPVDALPELPAWAEWGWTWAPGILHRDNGFVLYFVARSRALGVQCIGVATASRVAGPYTSPVPEPLVCQADLGGSIDPQPFVDRDGTAYLLWKSDANAIGGTSQLFAQPLRPDGWRLAGDPVALLSNDAGWEWPLIENPALLAADDAYFLLYSGGRWESGGYATGYAVRETPLGPCVKRTTLQPILSSTHGEAGTGGASVFTGPAGDHWLAYHAWAPNAVGYDNGGRRSLHFARLTWHANYLTPIPQA
jgi:beta-xylosidase